MEYETFRPTEGTEILLQLIAIKIVTRSYHVRSFIYTEGITAAAT